MITDPCVTSCCKSANTQYLSIRLQQLLVVAMLLVCGTASAAKDQATELEALQKKIETVREDVQGTRDRRNNAQQSLKKTETRIGRINRELRRLRRESRSAKKELQKLQARQQQERRQLVKQRNLMATQVRARYAMGRQEQVKILLSQSEPGSVQRVLVYYDYLNQARLRNINSVREQLESLLVVEQEISSRQQGLQRLLQTRKQSRSELKKQRKQRKKLLVGLNRKLKTKQAVLNRLLEDERRLQELLSDINKLSAPVEDIRQAGQRQRPFRKLKGALPWPTAGRLRARYGQRRSSHGGSWKGVLISANHGEAVTAVAHGRVAFADWLRGYGLLIIVDHGEGYMSLYGHNQGLYKEVGEWVDAGTVIASVGDSGGQSRSALYYEIRKQGQPVDPQRWSSRRKPRLARTAARP